MTKSLKVLFIPVEGTGHVNACISLGQALLRAGHKVVFAVSGLWQKPLTSYGFEVVVMKNEQMDNVEDPAKMFAQMLLDMKMLSDVTPLERLDKGDSEMAMLVDMTIQGAQNIGPVLDVVRPDVIVLDQFMTIPAVEKSGIPWVWVWSANPLYMYGNDYDVPAGRFGLPNTDKSSWKEVRDKMNKVDYDIWKKYNDFLVANGGNPLKEMNFTNGSPYLNVYGFPEELDYKDIKPFPKNYHRFDNLMRTEAHQEFEIPDQLKNKPGKLIYFSLGSMGAADVVNMKRLIGILAESKHRFIVSKGPLHEKYELADNMWGQSTVPQLPILPLVDLVITHGGNNTVTETFFFGKPMIVMPLFGDQPDNAQRIHDKGFGIRLDPYRCSKQELLDAIEKVLNDKELNDKMKNISRRIQTTKSIDQFPKLVEALVKN